MHPQPWYNVLERLSPNTVNLPIKKQNMPLNWKFIELIAEAFLPQQSTYHVKTFSKTFFLCKSNSSVGIIHAAAADLRHLSNLFAPTSKVRRAAFGHDDDMREVVVGAGHSSCCCCCCCCRRLTTFLYYKLMWKMVLGFLPTTMSLLA